MEFEEIIKKIEENKTYNEILKDSYGGVMYGLNTKDNYDIVELLDLFNLFSKNYDISLLDGIMLGVHNFIIELKKNNVEVM